MMTVTEGSSLDNNTIMNNRKSKLDAEEIEHNYMLGEKGLLYYTQNVPVPKPSTSGNVDTLK